MSNWRTIRERVAPKETRTAISFSRPIARASCRLATLAQAMRRTMPTTVKSTADTTGRKEPISTSMKGSDFRGAAMA